ncbi:MULTISPECIES: anthrone oxygenase family protein [Roseomonadaceae]|uniref:DUF1772 domain-containing protein n=1 Tax=Falsiroseomonas oleicola TaxID=2801474 RepID=A0ABS6H0W6_9PROT|nr:anthrone oxygenase family protein [Roseomonas oleicola]MBU8542312.1 DUF1772 domain-containing protein [Roseomonas oleicola]
MSGLAGLGLLASAWSSGFFWTWSFTVMPGLAEAPPEVAIAAMNAVNGAIRTPSFGFVFFGPLLLAGLLAAAAVWARHARMSAVAAAALLVYGAGVIGVTAAFNLPLNAGLAAAAPVELAAARAVWNDYAGPWSAWNHLRTLMATATFGLFLLAGLFCLRR